MKRLLFIISVIFTFLSLTVHHALAADWPMYMYDLTHSSNQNAEQILNTTNITSLKKLWSYKTGGIIAAQPVVYGSTVYVGSWDGNMYAFNRDTGIPLWKTFVGITTSSAQGCYPNKAGVTASAQLFNGVLYITGGDQNFYALDPSTGNILWKTQIYTSQVQGDYYNYGTAAITTVNGTPYAFVGLSSLCDNPLVHGQLLKINLTTHAIDNTLNIVPTSGPAGGGIWYTPAIDTSVNPPLLYVTTGTPQPGQNYAKAMLQINTATMQIQSYWHVPDSETNTTPDPDFGSSVTLFTTKNGTKMAIAGHKNGKLYALNTASLSAGPVWSNQIAIGGECPQCGQGTISTPVFDSIHNLLYVAGGKDPNASGSAGEVRAVDPATGNDVWTHEDLKGTVIADMAYTNGLLIYASTSNTNTLVALDASSGNQLFTVSLGGGAYGAPAISNGEVFIGDTAANVWAFNIPGLTPTQTPTPTPIQQCTPIASGAGQVANTISIPQTGNYTIWSRIESQDTNSNAYYLQIDGGCPIDVGDLSTMPANTWTWVNYQSGNNQNIISQNLSQGNHSIIMSGNKPNTKVDRIIFTSDPTCLPTGTGDNCVVGNATPTPTPSTGYNAQYFNNMTLSGTPILTRVDPTINFNWNGGSPDPSINNTQFSARWTGVQNFQAGEYEFTATADDGVRVYIDGNKVIDGWMDEPPTTYNTFQTLTAGNHTIIMEYYQNTGGDVAQLSFKQIPGTPTPTPIPVPPTPPPGQYSAEYYSNMTLSGTPTITRVDPVINFNWNGGSPDPAIPNNHFSARWTGIENFQNGSYTFTVTSDDGARLYIDGTKVLDAWIDQPPTTYTVNQNMTSGNHTIVMEYYQNTGGDIAQLNFQPNTNTPTPTP